MCVCVCVHRHKWQFSVWDWFRWHGITTYRVAKWRDNWCAHFKSTDSISLASSGGCVSFQENTMHAENAVRDVVKAMAKSKCKCNMDSLGNEMSSNPKRCLYSMLYSLHQAIYNILRIHFSSRAAFRHRTNFHQYNINKCERAYRSMTSLYFIFYKQYSIH